MCTLLTRKKPNDPLCPQKIFDFLLTPSLIFIPEQIIHYKSRLLSLKKLSMQQQYLHMADHAGSRRSVVNPGTKLPHVEITQFWRQRSSFALLWNQTKINSSVRSQTVPWFISNNFCFILFPRLLINIIIFCLTKNRGQNRSSGAKSGLLRRAGATT